MRALSVMIALVLGMGSALAMPPPANHARRAKALYDAGEFTAAIDEYQAAYEEDSQAKWLFNIAQSYRRSDDGVNAIVFYRRYLEADPDGVGAADARTYLKQLEADSPPEQPEPQPEPGPDRRPAPIPTPYRAADRTSPGPGLGSSPVPQRPVDLHPGHSLQRWGSILAGVGVGGLVVAAYFEKAASGKADEIRRLTPGTSMWNPSLESDGRLDDKLAWITGTVGGLSLVTGFILYYSGKRADTVASQIYAAPTPRGAALGLLRRF